MHFLSSLRRQGSSDFKYFWIPAGVYPRVGGGGNDIFHHSLKGKNSCLSRDFPVSSFHEPILRRFSDTVEGSFQAGSSLHSLHANGLHGFGCLWACPRDK